MKFDGFFSRILKVTCPRKFPYLYSHGLCKPVSRSAWLLPWTGRCGRRMGSVDYGGRDPSAIPDTQLEVLSFVAINHSSAPDASIVTERLAESLFTRATVFRVPRLQRRPYSRLARSSLNLGISRIRKVVSIVMSHTIDPPKKVASRAPMSGTTIPVSTWPSGLSP